ncbi:polysaccharide deacetylase family protein [Proteinivorax tanatarense]|uniref:Polysaccharide deacetylase family protein n=1 Tax=Proteinivorax tanatarense TaxID=1260629 RepID=A0AAU7VNY1_9FIRM
MLTILSGCFNGSTDYIVEECEGELKQDNELTGKKEEHSKPNHIDYPTLKEEIVNKYADVEPKHWGENIDGVITEINADKKVIALTFDACDGEPNGYDSELINFLKKEKIPATLFVSGEWIKKNQDTFLQLAENPLFEIANHGYKHRPLSVSGKSIYNISGTESVEEVFEEIYNNQMLIKELTGDTPNYFRSGTAYYDDVAIKILNDLDLKPVNYNILGDAGGTFTKEQIFYSLKNASKGSIILFHMNQPNSPIAEGVKEGVLYLKEQGFQFIKLSDYHKYLQ